ncbi:hypothetical protein [Herbaspirillum sp.]|uniref:hypothetical protein n=1 Tax=Herbaspirillum sp. TaxID=1890675 RepID=UPI00257FF3F6|nr:hypothetical protein [Herbaspirillum sp.]|tara:strand:- start:398 stop:553 length:156 start_codon:yes stop_codon:yes gene_type:complete
MPKKKKAPPKRRNWLAVHAKLRSGAGPHGPGKGHKQKYNRKKKHKKGESHD